MSSRPAVLITGAAKRLGKAIALHLAQQGYDIALHYHHSGAEAKQTQQELEALGARCELFAADLANASACQDLLSASWQSFGKLDALVNNASLFELDLPDTTSSEMLSRHYQVNTIAPLLLSEALYAKVKSVGGKAAIVHMLDQKLWNLNSDFFSYTLSKSALKTALTLQAKSFAPWLRVLGVAPGMTLESHLTSDEKFAELSKLRLTPQSQGLADVVQSVAFALQNQSMTGNVLLVDYGQHLMKFENDFSLM